MKISELGTVNNPVNVSIRTAKPPTFKEFVAIVAVSVIPIAAAVLMQKPALRQALIMKACHMSKEFCHWQADQWNKLGDSCSQAYIKAKL